MELRLGVSPHGRIYCEPTPAVENTLFGQADDWAESSARLVLDAFAESSATGLLLLAGQTLATRLPVEFSFWREWARGYFHKLSQLDETALASWEASHKADSSKTRTEATRVARTPAVAPTADKAEAVAPPMAPPVESAAKFLIAGAPPMRGLEYLTPSVLANLWRELDRLVRERAATTRGGIRAFIREVNPFRQQLGRVTFHLAENKRDPARPFAFLATYTSRLSAKAAVQHLPLAEALKRYASEGDQPKLKELLTPVTTAAKRSAVVNQWLESRALFQPQALTIDEAYRFLRDVPQLEESGLVVRVPNWWQARKTMRPAVQVRLGSDAPSQVGLESLLDFSVDLALDGERLSAEERRQLQAAPDGLFLLRGKWVEVDQTRLKQALTHWQQLKKEHAGGIDFLTGMRLMAGARIDGTDAADDEQEISWIDVRPGDWLRDTLARIRDPNSVTECLPGEGLNATLRPYQTEGVRWLWFMTRLRLGACLADDMGLGKTIQVIDLLLRMKLQDDLAGRAPSLLVVPASLVGNWKQELARFAPQLNVFFAHRSESDAATLDQVAADPQCQLADHDLVVTTYTLARNAAWFSQVSWKLVILDEAQAIKNSSSAQTKSVKKLKSAGRIVLTGTPVENQLGDLWSLFDFCCPGLLGSWNQFKGYIKRLNQRQDSEAYSSLRRLVQPYILRRLKTDASIVPDLPEKTEMRTECGLSKRQAVLYQQAVTELSRQLKQMREQGQTDGIQRRGVVLSTTMRLKQICNHPAQYLNNSAYAPDESGKFGRLKEICEPIAERQEKMLVFTQFQTLCQPLADFLATCFCRPGLVLHGGVPVAKRKEFVRLFQEDDTLPFFVISVKAGGTGLNLTAASHVVHFDRWWNPAVENQATDRAFRIGQKRNVLVHKFVCRGTLEERIDQVIRDKQQLADKILGTASEGETLLTEMSDQELLDFVSLDIRRAEQDL